MAEDVAAKLIGSYELELAAVIEEGIALRPPVVVNIGSGEGYYAVGLAMRCPTSHVVAYDTDPMRQLWSAKMADANRVSGRMVRLRGNGSGGDRSGTDATAKALAPTHALEWILAQPLMAERLSGAGRGAGDGLHGP